LIDPDEARQLIAAMYRLQDDAQSTSTEYDMAASEWLDDQRAA